MLGWELSPCCTCRALQMLGAQIEGPEQRSFNGLDVQLWPRVSWSPLFVLTFADLKVRGTRYASMDCALPCWLSRELWMYMLCILWQGSNTPAGGKSTGPSNQSMPAQCICGLGFQSLQHLVGIHPSMCV